jgi:CheY-like chemotaxis protein
MAVKRVFTTGQVAKICKVAPRTVSLWFDSGKLRGDRIPGSQDRRIPRDHLIKFLKEHGMPLGDLETEERYKVLVVGAERPFFDRLRELLPEADDYHCELAANTWEAGARAQSLRLDAIIFDLALGRTEALQITESLRLDPRYGRALILALADEDEEEPDELTQYGLNDVFPRSSDVTALAERIQSEAVAWRDGF